MAESKGPTTFPRFQKVGGPAAQKVGGPAAALPRSNLGGARQLVRNHEQTGTVAPSENGRLPPVPAHQLASAHKSFICPKRSPDSVTY